MNIKCSCYALKTAPYFYLDRCLRTVFNDYYVILDICITQNMVYVNSNLCNIIYCQKSVGPNYALWLQRV